MKLYFMDIFVAEDSPVNCALYTFSMMEVLKQTHEKKIAENAKKEMDLAEKLKNMTFEELMRMERKEDGEGGT